MKAHAILLLLALIPGPLQPQSPRALLKQGHEAYDFAEFDRAIPLLSLGLNPAAGPRDSLWVSGLHKLAHALIENGQDSLAKVWLRWGARTARTMPVDSVNFPPPVVQALASARDFVDRSSADSLVVRVGYQWPATPPASASGLLLIQRGQPPVSGRIEGGDSLQLGSPRAVPAGSYAVLATAEGYQPARAMVELLPGVTTVLAFTLAPVLPGFLYVASRPWGTLYLDGQRIGYTAIAAHRVMPGEHHLRIERQGFAPFDTTITVTQNEQVRLGPIRLEGRPQ